MWLLMTDAGYGFTVKLSELHSRQRAGKAILRVTENARCCRRFRPRLIHWWQWSTRSAVIPASDVPELPGKATSFRDPTKRAEREECWWP
jgi:hypothetical protein